ncbi:MAG TPA: class I SAM-dependent methyltransferase [Tepidisphaeraceae bacterium]|jgi:SAM-dependent methyltransferase|nr:class I SAM-dependent methyltransferase [Tepidisphaeraceae bacterium]
MIDFGRTSLDYARYRIPFSLRLFERLQQSKIGCAGQHVLDLGAGTGLLGAGLKDRGCVVTSIDPSIELLGRSESSGSRVAGCAEILPFENDCFDVIAAAQCWHWFDRHAAPREIHRVLKPGGSVAVIYQTYIPLPDGIAERTEKLILRHHPGWRHANSTGINGQVLRDLQINRFIDIESFSFDIEAPFSREAWQGYIRTTSAVGASMTPEQLLLFDHEHAEFLKDEPEPMRIPHRIFAAVARKPGSSV